MKYKHGDLLLGIDPGYSNLGLAIVEVTPEGPRVRHTTCVTLGKRGNPRGFLAPTQRHMNEILKYDFIAWATEAPPTVPNRVTANLLWFSTGLIWSQIYKKIAKNPALVAPARIKTHTARVLGIKSSKHWSPGKELVGQAVSILTDEPADQRTNHENDAIMAVISAFMPEEIKKGAKKWEKQTS